MIFFKIIWAFVPFLREMLFPGKTNTQVLIENKFAFGLLFLLGLSFSFNWIMIERIYLIAMDRKSTGAVVIPSRPASAALTTMPGSAASAAKPDEESDDEKRSAELKERLNSLFAK